MIKPAGKLLSRMTPVVLFLVLTILACATSAQPAAIGKPTNISPQAPGVGPSKNMPPQTPTAGQPAYEGRLLLQKLEFAGGSYHSLGVYEFEAGWKEPSAVAGMEHDFSVVSGEIQAYAADQHKLVFGLHSLWDMNTGEVTALAAPGLDGLKPDYPVYQAAFSPDGKRLVYRVGHPYEALFVLDFTTGQTVLIHQGGCAAYMSGLTCEQVGSPTWIDPDTLIFSHHRGLPATYRPGSKDDPATLNHFTVMTSAGKTIFSEVLPANSQFRAVGGTVFKYFNSFTTEWMEGTDLVNGIYDAHKFSLPGELPYYGAAISTVSPDGRYLLAVEKPHWRLVEVRTGQETALGTQFQPYLLTTPNLFDRACQWSSDAAQVACLVEDKSRHASILVIPLSAEPGRVVFTETGDNISWRLLDWLRD